MLATASAIVPEARDIVFMRVLSRPNLVLHFYKLLNNMMWGSQTWLMPHTFLSRPLTRSFANVWCCAASCLEAVGRLSNPRQMHGGHFDRRRRRNKTHVECFGCRQNKKVGGIKLTWPRPFANWAN